MNANRQFFRCQKLRVAEGGVVGNGNVVHHDAAGKNGKFDIADLHVAP